MIFTFFSFQHGYTQCDPIPNSNFSPSIYSYTADSLIKSETNYGSTITYHLLNNISISLGINYSRQKLSKSHVICNGIPGIHFTTNEEIKKILPFEIVGLEDFIDITNYHSLISVPFSLEKTMIKYKALQFKIAAGFSFNQIIKRTIKYELIQTGDVAKMEHLKDRFRKNYLKYHVGIDLLLGITKKMDVRLGTTLQLYSNLSTLDFLYSKNIGINYNINTVKQKIKIDNT